MNTSQQKGWAILTDEEKTALNLSLVSGKSTWESGEIMGKAHYKYLEIRQRAEKFFQIFTEYFKHYESLIPKNIPMDANFKKYIRATISDRKSIKEVISQIDNVNWKTPKLRDVEVAKAIQKIKNSQITQDQNLYHLIMDFDRWNNFRILPSSIQEPSAFKRRNKHKLRKLVNMFVSVNPLAIRKIKQLYSIKRKELVNDYFYLPLITIQDKKLTEVIKVAKNKKNLKMINDMVLYGFNIEADALKFISILKGYIYKDFKHCRDGQKFWPEFRVLTSKAINHDYIQNITPSRKYVLDNAGKDFDFQVFLSSRSKQE